MTYSRSNARRKRKTPLKRFILYSALVVLCIFLIGGGSLAYMGYQMADATSKSHVELDRGDRSMMRQENVDPKQDPVSILFLGIDSREEDLRGRTDAMVLATFNPEEESINMLTIPRDARVKIVGRNSIDKINHAHSFGGIDMTVDTVERLLEIPVDYFVTLNFISFVEIINELGGVDVNVPFTFSESDSTDRRGAITIYEGEQTLNGEEALAYVRMRKHDPAGDMGRGERQKEVLESLIKKAVSFQSITRFGAVMESVEEHMNTNLTFNNIVSFHNYARNLDEIESLTLDGAGVLINNIYYFELDNTSLNEVQSILKEHLEIENEEQI
ncbi:MULTISPECIES: LCP family protein [Bacillaceae]|uniref:LCP family protein n=1 Tax=Evansella alkalicola TaxID=745819 RepID=A0ABS6JTB3_9BACI|nr:MULTISPECIES: LCP family protein [Bacillaceae]MBU9721743.1 LCP family protein [Bacillus alkalicola]